MRRRPLRLGPSRSCLWTSSGRGPRLLALHGFTGSGADFAPLADRLTRPFAAPDLPGHGRADCPPPAACRLGRVAEDLGRLADRLDATALLGYSMGGRHALALALARPARFEALILVGASPGLADVASRAERTAWDESWARRAERGPPDAFAEAWSQLPLLASQDRIPAPARRSMEARRRRNRPRGLAASLRGAGTGSMGPLWDDLRRLTLPTLLLVGEEDERYQAIAVRMAERLPDPRIVVVPGAGHCAHLEQPDAAAAAIEDFLGTVLRP